MTEVCVQCGLQLGPHDDPPFGPPRHFVCPQQTKETTTMKKNSILRETEYGTYYTGPLKPAVKAMRDEYGDALVTVRCEDGTVTIEERRGSPEGAPNQWGTGPDEETAWRYLIGTDFGPLDETYEAEGYEQHQRRMLGLSD